MKKLFYLFMVTVCATMFTSCSKDDDKDPLDDNGGNGSKEGMITMVVAKGVGEISMYIETFNEGDIITIDWGDGDIEKFKSFTEYDEDGYECGYIISNDEVWNESTEHYYFSSNTMPHTITIKGKIKELLFSEGTRDTGLTSLDVSKCPALEFLECERCNLTSLDVSKNTALKELCCSNNNLTALDVSKCTALEELWCSNNNLTALDVSKCTALEELWCYSNNLISLDVSKNTALKFFLDCHSNNFSASALNQIFRDLPQGKTWIKSGSTWQSLILIGDNPGATACDQSIATNKGWKVRLYW